MTPLHTYQQHWGAVTGFDTFERLPEIKAPTLLITGTSDLLVPDANSDIIKERIPGARIHKLPGVGHVFFWEEAGGECGGGYGIPLAAELGGSRSGHR